MTIWSGLDKNKGLEKTPITCSFWLWQFTKSTKSLQNNLQNLQQLSVHKVTMHHVVHWKAVNTLHFPEVVQVWIWMHSGSKMRRWFLIYYMTVRAPSQTRGYQLLHYLPTIFFILLPNHFESRSVFAHSCFPSLCVSCGCILPYKMVQYLHAALFSIYNLWQALLCPPALLYTVQCSQTAGLCAWS